MRNNQIRGPTTYKLNREKYEKHISRHKESKFQGSPFPISKNMDSQMIRSFAGCAVSKCKPLLQNMRQTAKITPPSYNQRDKI